MTNKHLLGELLWVIPGDAFENFMFNEEKIIDGNVISFSKKIGKTHLDFLPKLFDELKIENPSSWSDISCALALAKSGFATVVNSGRPIDGKYYAAIFLPKQMTLKQINFFEENKDLFLENYNDALLETAIFTDEKLPYNKPYRDLKIEKRIEGKENYRNIDMLYEELERQKEVIKTK